MPTGASRAGPGFAHAPSRITTKIYCNTRRSGWTKLRKGVRRAENTCALRQSADAGYTASWGRRAE